MYFKSATSILRMRSDIREASPPFDNSIPPKCVLNVPYIEAKQVNPRTVEYYPRWGDFEDKTVKKQMKIIKRLMKQGEDRPLNIKKAKVPIDDAPAYDHEDLYA